MAYEKNFSNRFVKSQHFCSIQSWNKCTFFGVKFHKTLHLVLEQSTICNLKYTLFDFCILDILQFLPKMLKYHQSLDDMYLASPCPDGEIYAIPIKQDDERSAYNKKDCEFSSLHFLLTIPSSLAVRKCQYSKQFRPLYGGGTIPQHACWNSFHRQARVDAPQSSRAFLMLLFFTRSRLFLRLKV